VSSSEGTSCDSLLFTFHSTEADCSLAVHRGRFKGFQRVELRLKRDTLLRLGQNLVNRSI
jgi:hypothetical protein